MKHHSLKEDKANNDHRFWVTPALFIAYMKRQNNIWLYSIIQHNDSHIYDLCEAGSDGIDLITIS